MHFKMVHFNIIKQNLELVILKCVTYAQPIPVSIGAHSHKGVELKLTPSFVEIIIL